MFPETNYMEKDSTKSLLALVKTNRVSKYMLSVQKLCCSWHKYKGPSKNNYPVILLVMPSVPNPNQYQNIKNKEKLLNKLLQNNK